jgi:signal peptide peptidase SppA
VSEAEQREVRYQRVWEVVTQTPWEILPATLEMIVEIVAFRVEGGRLSDEELAAKLEAASPQKRQPYATVGGSGGSVAVLPMYGVIMPRASLFSAISGGVGLTQFQAAFQAALDDPDVSAILLDFDTPGGNTALVAETAQMIRDARGGKPIVAIADTLCASAGYHLASQADELVASPSALIGSVGVFATHQDISQLQAGLGVKTTLISAGKFKTEGNQYEPLSEEAQAAIQGLVDDAYDQFVADIAKGRGVTASAVRAGFGQGRVVSAKQAVAEGMADRVDTIDATIARLAHAPSRARVGTKAKGDAPELEANSAALIPLLASIAAGDKGTLLNEEQRNAATAFVDAHPDDERSTALTALLAKTADIPPDPEPGPEEASSRAAEISELAASLRQTSQTLRERTQD